MLRRPGDRFRFAPCRAGGVQIGKHGIPHMELCALAGNGIALSPDVETAHKMLMDSPLHRENILQPKYTEIGIGVRPDSRGGVYLVQEFIGP